MFETPFGLATGAADGLPPALWLRGARGANPRAPSVPRGEGGEVAVQILL